MEADKSKGAKWQHANWWNEKLASLVINMETILCPTDIVSYCRFSTISCFMVLRFGACVFGACLVVIVGFFVAVPWNSNFISKYSLLKLALLFSCLLVFNSPAYSLSTESQNSEPVILCRTQLVACFWISCCTFWPWRATLWRKLLVEHFF